MRQVKEFDTTHGRRYRVRFRQGGTETSETFRSKQDARTFAALLDSGPDGVAEALRWLADREKQGHTATFGEWFDSYVAQLTGITPRTRDDYKAMRRRYLTGLDLLPLPLVTRAHVADIVNTLEREGKSPKTIKNVVHMLSSVMALAIDEGLITRNPCKRVRLPRAKLDEHQARFLTHEEFAALIGATPAHYRPLVVFLVGTGLRWSEATALQARHVDVKAGTVRVQQAWKRIPGGWEIGPPKSRKAIRTVNAATMALAAVHPLLRKPSDPVFVTPQGNIVRHANFYNRIWVPACKAAGLDPRPRIHDTRHTHASWLISDGQSLEAIQDQLGHESIETTRRVYGHLLPAIGVALGRAASEALERALPAGWESPAELSRADTA
jgi:integrase